RIGPAVACRRDDSYRIHAGGEVTKGVVAVDVGEDRTLAGVQLAVLVRVNVDGPSGQPIGVVPDAVGVDVVVQRAGDGSGRLGETIDGGCSLPRRDGKRGGVAARGISAAVAGLRHDPHQIG